MRIILSTVVVALLAGCQVAATAEDYHWTVKAPAKVVMEPHSRLQFVVEANTSAGTPVRGVPYIWTVDWVGIQGVRHQGWSFEEESLRVKGAPGTAVLRILAYDRWDRIVEVARASFEVTPQVLP
jgi:hypothetical protein